MIREIIIPQNHVTCDSCFALLQYDAEDVTPCDDGVISLYTFKCPKCGEELFVIPVDIATKQRKGN